MKVINMELEIICSECGKHGSLQRTYSEVHDEHLKFNNAYLCWANGERDWWELETKTVIGICPKCLKKCFLRCPDEIPELRERKKLKR